MDGQEGSWVRVQIDWSAANIDPNGASVYFFPKDGGEPRLLVTNNTLDSLCLPVGEYNVLVFNERINEHDNIAFRGTDAYETFEAYAVSETALPDFMQQQAATSGGISVDRPENTKAGDEAVADPDVLAVATQDLQVTEKMVREGISTQLDFVPQRITVEVQLTVRVTGAQYLANGGSGGSISGMTEGVMLATKQPTAVPVNQYFTFRRMKLVEGSKTKGDLQATFSTFGPVGTSLTDDAGSRNAAKTNLLRMQFFMRDGSIYTPDGEFNVTGHFIKHTVEHAKNLWTLILKLLVGLDIWGNDDNPIPLPIVEGESGGINADVSDWGEDEIIETDL
jgi:hypothetical protein